jgi:hypothetical protein
MSLPVKVVGFTVILSTAIALVGIVVNCQAQYAQLSTSDHFSTHARAKSLVNECDLCTLGSPIWTQSDTGILTTPLFAQIFELGITEPAGGSPFVTAQVGRGPQRSDPRTGPGWVWTSAFFNGQIGNNDEYQGSFIAPLDGAYSYTFRFSLDGGVNWSYADLDGNSSGATFSTLQLGTLYVPSAPPAPNVLSTNPTDGASNVSTSTSISVTFDQAMTPATITTQTGNGPCSASLQISTAIDNFDSCLGFASGTTSTAGGNTIFTGVPARPLAASTTYKIRVTTEVQSSSGRRTAAQLTQSAGFTTEPASANIHISGRVTSSGGRGVTHAQVTLTGASLPNPVIAFTDRKGRYSFASLAANQNFTVQAFARRFTFTPSSQNVQTGSGDLSNIDFIGSP